MKTPHKHAELIKAWADGTEIELLQSPDSWTKASNPGWYEDSEYRIKPEPKPDVVRYGVALLYWGRGAHSLGDNIRVIFDGETGKLKAAEVI